MTQTPVMLGCLIALSIGTSWFDKTWAAESQAAEFPTFEFDPTWPKELPNNFVLGEVTGIAVDAADHIWVVHQQDTLDSSDPSRKRILSAANLLGATKQPPLGCCRHAPEVIEFDSSGNYVQGWGGPHSPTDVGAKFEWPISIHGISVDHKNNVWFCGSGRNAEQGKQDNQCLKFTKNGKFLLQIGRSGKSKGSLDTENLNRAAHAVVWPKTNEVFIADGYTNRRVIVFDADTGKFKRMWGAYGSKPDDSVPNTRTLDGPPPQQFNTVHGIQISHDGLVYVSDRQNNRVQVFTVQGKFVRESFIARGTPANYGTSFSSALSADEGQRFLYVADVPNYKLRVLDRLALKEIPEAGFGRAGLYPGQVIELHHIATDSKGNLYFSDSATGVVQRWLFKGMKR